MTCSATLLGVPRPATGTVESYAHADGRTVSYYARVRANGRRHRLNLGKNHEGWNRERAQVELDRIMAQIERGTWEPPGQLRAVTDDEPQGSEAFHIFASRWWGEKKGTLSDKGREDYEWRLAHLLGFFHKLPVRSITVREVDRYRAQKVRDRERLEEAWRQHRANPQKVAKPERRPLGNRAINMTLMLLAQILDDAVEYGLLDANPARGKKRRLPAQKSRRNFLEPDMVVDLLDAAGEWEREQPEAKRYGRRTVLAALCLGGFRVSELIAANRAMLDLHGGRLRVGDSKTEAGLRDVELTAFLQGELRAHLARLGPQAATAPVFPATRGGRLNAPNIRNRLIAESVRRANAKREGEGRMLLPAITPHGLRRTFASLLLSAGRDVRFVMSQLGHTDPSLTLAVYAQVLQRQRVDRDLVWQLCRFSDEPESTAPPGRMGGQVERPGDALHAPGRDTERIGPDVR